MSHFEEVTTEYTDPECIVEGIKHAFPWAQEVEVADVPSTTFEQSYSFDCATGPQWVVTNTGDEARTVLLQYQTGELNGMPQYATVSSTTVPAGEEVTLDFADAVPAEDTTCRNCCRGNRCILWRSVKFTC